jgi:trigger factor
MNCSISKKGDYIIEFACEASYDELKPLIEKELQEYRSKVQIDGFRKGKAPLNLIKKIYGEGIEYKAAEKFATDYFWKEIEKEEKQPISTPIITEFEISSDKGLKCKISYEIIPDIEIRDYLDLEIKKLKIEYNEKNAAKEIESLRKYNSELKDVDVIDDKNCVATVKFSKISDNPDEKIEPITQTVDLSNENIKEDLLNLLMGKKVGNTFEYSYEEKKENETKLHKYNCEILKVQKYDIQPLSEEKIKIYSKNAVSTEEDFKKLLIEENQNYFNKISEDTAENELIDTILKNNPIDLPPKYVEKVFEEILEVEKNKRKNDSINNLLNDQNLIERLKEKAKKTAHFRIIMKNIGRIHNITVSDEEIEERAEKDAAEQKVDPQLLKTLYKKPTMKEYLLEEKIVDFIKSRTKFIEYVPEEEKESKEN